MMNAYVNNNAGNHENSIDTNLNLRGLSLKRDNYEGV
jgi:hypothetical protein